VGKASIQVLRSAPAAHCSKELKASSVTGRIGTQQDIHVAMQNLIAKATRFIYIENQFFVSDFGAIGGGQNELSPAAAYIKNGADGISDSTLWIVRSAADGARNDPALDRLPQNKILPALLARLRQVILDDASKPKFHIYFTLPVHPEGAVIDPTIAVQVYYTMQTLVFGSHSLMKGIKRLLKARELKDKKEKSYLDVWENISNNSFESISDEACFEYVTLLNLRNWAKIGTAYITEQIYVHSKLMIVDDRFALMGSANINDRSLLGERDSELAVLIMDEDTVRADINGKGSNQPVRAFAHELRKKIWNKIFGVTSGERSALDLKIAVEEPGHPESWRKIRDRAEKNTDLYDKAFPFIPRNKSPNAQLAKQSASILPTWDPNLKEIGKKTVGGLASPMPFQDEFWNKIRNTDDAENLTSIRGYITALPVEWTKGENIAIKYPTAIIVKNDGDAPLVDPQVSEVVLASSDRPSKIESEQQG
jgi:phospholipase D1/2